MKSHIPPSLIPPAQAVTEKSMFPPDDPGRECWFDEDEKLWVSVIFPSKKPSGRQDVLLLEQWLNQALAEQAIAPGAGPERTSAVVKSQLDVLMVGFREVVRQVAAACAERGRLLDKIWKSMSTLLEFVVKEMRGTIAACEDRMGDLNLRASRHEHDMLLLKELHAQEVKIMTQSLGHKWGGRVEVLKQELISKENELLVNLETVRLLKRWFPNFNNYSHTVFTDLLPANMSSEMTMMLLLPEEALKQDMLRTVSCTISDMKMVSCKEDGGDHR